MICLIFKLKVSNENYAQFQLNSVSFLLPIKLENFYGKVFRLQSSVARMLVNRVCLMLLLGQDRAIVTDIAGTTRDQIHEKISINGIPVSLMDTAGLRETFDIVESIGVERAKRSMADADFVIVLLDGSQAITHEDLTILNLLDGISHLVAINKSDLEQCSFDLNGSKIIRISAKTGEGLDDLQKNITEPFLTSSDVNSGFLISDARHYDLLLRARAEIDNSIQLLNKNLSEEIILVGLHNSINLLGQITGETTNDDMLTQIFSTFCIGK